MSPTKRWLYPSIEWVEQLAERLNDMPEYRDSSELWQGSIVLAAQAQPGLLEEDFAVSLDPTGGKITDIHRVADHEDCDAAFVLFGPYSVWKDIINGEHDIMHGVMNGLIKLRGNVFQLMLQLKTPKIMLEQMRTMPTRFVDEV